MKNYYFDYNIHSLFEREKSNKKLKERLDNIKYRKNLFLPNINPLYKSQSQNSYNVSKNFNNTSPSKQNLFDNGKDYELRLNNKRLHERLVNIEKKENKYLFRLSPEKDLYFKNKIIYNKIQRKLKEDKISHENNVLTNRIEKLNPFISCSKLDLDFNNKHSKVINNMKKVKELKIIEKQMRDKYSNYLNKHKATNNNSVYSPNKNSYKNTLNIEKNS